MTLAVRFVTMTNRALSTTDAGATDPTTISAAERAVEAAQRIVVERLELMRLEFLEALAQRVQRSGLVLAAGFITILGWCGLAAALVMVLAERMPLATGMALVAGVHVLAGLGLGLAATSMTGRKTT
jgi:Putative Actinobacterial Holin-X, holin superfamily III